MRKVLLAVFILFRVLFVESAHGSGINEIESIDGKEVVVRVYKNWRQRPADFEKVSVNIDNGWLKFDSAKIANGAVVAVVAEEQKDTTVKKFLGDSVYAEVYKKGLRLHLSLYYSAVHQDKWLTFKDALGNPIAQAEVEIFLFKYKGAKVMLAKKLLDEKGRLKLPKPNLRGSLRMFSFIVSHPDYGIAEIKNYPYLDNLDNLTNIKLPFVHVGTKADERAIWGVIVDPNGNPVSGASVRCRNVSTLGEGLITSGCFTNVITDETGRFYMYLPNKDNRDVRGTLIPPKSKYHVRIEAPKELGLLLYVGEIVNGEETMITLERGGYYRTFVFKDENGQIIDPNKLKNINLVIKRADKPRFSLEYEDWKAGGMFPLGVYQTKMVWGPADEFEPLEVTADSPKELVFKVKSEILYYGRVVDGLTDEPMQGAFVIGVQNKSGNLSQITPQQWDVMHALGDNPSADAEALAPLRKIYSFEKVARTDQDGRFQITSRSGREIYNFVALEEDYLGFRHGKRALEPDENKRAEVPVIKLHPAAKIMVEPCVETEHVCITPKLIIDTNNNPSWVKQFFSSDDWKERFEYGTCLKENNVQTFYVPADLSLRIQLEIRYDSRWCPIIIDQLVNLKQGEIIDLGRHTFQQAISIYVKIIDSNDKPIEGVPVHKFFFPNRLGIVHNTDENGIAGFNVPPHSKGMFVVNYSMFYLKEALPYEVGGEEDAGREFTLTLSDEMLYRLFK